MCVREGIFVCERMREGDFAHVFYVFVRLSQIAGGGCV